MSVARVVDVPRVTKPYSRAMAGDRRARACASTRPFGARRAPYDGRRADVRELARTRRPRVEHRRARRQEARARRRTHAKAPRQVAAEGALVHGQGKWYPGEQLPRWSLGCYFRRDGVPAVERRRLSGAKRRRVRSHDGGCRAFRSTRGSTPRSRRERARAGVRRRVVLPVARAKAAGRRRSARRQLSDPLERDRLSRVFRQGLEATAGWVLPLAHDASAGSRRRWFFREERCFLLPGDSPIGFRLPLDSLPWAAPEDAVQGYPADPFAPRAPLKQVFRFPSEAPETSGATESTRAAAFPPVTHRALRRAAPRNAARLHAAALRARGVPRARRGRRARRARTRPAGSDRGLPASATIRGSGRSSVTPDPGRHRGERPAAQVVERIARADGELCTKRRARRSSAAEKFEDRWRHIGRAGATTGARRRDAGDSPFLRRPDLLASLVAYWHNHPSLSYLFSGRFLGPTSQAPRVDEARNDSVYELEIALKRLAEGRRGLPPWLVDRLFPQLADRRGGQHAPRRILHRQALLARRPRRPPGAPRAARFRDAAALRACASVQQLLLRAMVARFWNEPYTRRSRSGARSLHDRFISALFRASRISATCSRTCEARATFPTDWFAPALRVSLSVLWARREGRHRARAPRRRLEPWHVLGEETTGGGQARTSIRRSNGSR